MHRVDDQPYIPSIPGLYFSKSMAREKLFGGSVGGSKTTTLACECIALSVKWDNNRGFVGERDFDDLRRGLWNEILAWLPESSALVDGHDLYQVNRSEHWLRFWNGSEIHAIELKDEPRNVNLGWAAIDQAERVPYSSLNWMRTRLRLPHIEYRPLMLSANPEPGWVKDEFITGSTPERTGILRRNEEELVVFHKGASKLFVPAFPEDNEHLPRGYIESLYSSLPEEMIARLLRGDWDVVANAVYSMLDRSVHLKEREPDRRIVRAAIGVDYGEVHPSAVYVVGLDQFGYSWVCEGWAAPTPEQDDFDNLLSVIARLRGVYGVSKPMVRCDPMLKGWDKQHGFSLASGAPGSRKKRIETVIALLNGKVGRIGSSRVPSLYFDANGEGVVEAFEQAMVYRWEHRETDYVIERVPVRKDDDRVAAIEYAVEALQTTAEYPYMGRDEQVERETRRRRPQQPTQVGYRRN